MGRDGEDARQGLTKAIGVANFSTMNLEKLLKTSKVIRSRQSGNALSIAALGQAQLVLQVARYPLDGLRTARWHEIDLAHASNWVCRGWNVILKRVAEKRAHANPQIFPLGDTEVAELNRLPKTEGRRFIRSNWEIAIFHNDEDDDGVVV
ncbi:hypothetical protein CC78DRAFT_585540 [Lojkania enalia]|uniref:Uncharacterized protein n=1 Tax=Lojkania enalia TaxID=147567 RepID=A0A9P4JZF4_9PLEO|nr:hypothetical protein CC78DRAFT_585540 [Didymosphaeria enalia]